MPKPLRSDDPRPQSVQFTHFGVLNDGQRSKGAAITSTVVNLLVVLVIVLLGLVVKSNPKMAKQLTELTLPPEPPPPPVVKRPPPPPPPKPLPTPPKITPPKTVEPPPPDIKPIEVPIPKPVVMAPAPPKAMNPPAAPVKVDLANPRAAAIKNNDPHPSAVRMGTMDSAISPTGPAVAKIDLGRAGANTNASNTGSGPRTSNVQLGTGNPNGSNLNGHDSGSRQIAGVKLGHADGTGPVGSRNYSNQPVNTNLGVAPVAASTQPKIQSLTASLPPKVIYKPAPIYSAEARSLHLEGNVSVKIKVMASGAVEVVGITHSLGHGLDESARQAVLGTRFKPATDATGHPVDWEGVVVVNFQLS